MMKRQLKLLGNSHLKLMPTLLTLGVCKKSHVLLICSIFPDTKSLAETNEYGLLS